MADGSKSEEDYALEQAAATSQPFELTSARTESTDTWALPDGTWSVKRYGTPVRMLRGGAWIATDPTLAFATDGTVVPKASTVSVAFSGGGSGPLLSGVKDGRTLSLSWPKPLPKPTLSENVATYADVLPGVDLQLKAEVEGFSQLLVVKTAQAAANPELTSLKYKLDTVGVSVSTDAETGSVTAVNPAGETVFTSPSPLMWDSTSITSGGAAPAARTALTAGEGETPTDAFEPAPGAQDAQMPTTVSGDTLEIKPDQALLTGADTKYPVFIDPSWAWGKRQNWTRVYKKYPNTSFWNTKEVVRVGYENETNGLSRSFFQLDTSNIKGAQVKTSTFRIKNTWSWSCQDRPVELWHVGAISSKTTWNKQPAKYSRLYTVDDAKGWSKDCAAGNLEFDATAKVREAASKNWSSLNLGLYASDETDTFGWKKFDAKTAVLETTYNNPPKTPSGLGTNPKSDCKTGGAIGNTRVSVYAKIDDKDAGNLSAEFQIFKTGATTPTVTKSIPAAKGKVATYVVPDSDLPTDSYTWKVRAKDQDGAYSAWSATCKFSVDRTRPSQPPVISSVEFPNGENGWPATTGKARTPGSFTFTPNGVTDAVEYGWYTDFNPQVNHITVAAGGTATDTFKPPSYGPHFVYAFSVDKAGNRSDTATYIYYAGRSLDRDGPTDLNGDTISDIWSVDSNGTLLTYAGQGNGDFASATNGGKSFEGNQVDSRGDWGQDGYNDLVSLEYDGIDKTKKLWTYPNNGTGVIRDEYTQLTVACPVKDPETGCDYGDEWTGDDHWHNAEQIVTPGDLNGDTQPDVLVKQGKQLWAYYGNRAGYTLDTIREPVLVGGGDWDKFSVIAPGDLNGDTIADLWLRDNATGDILRSYGKKGPDGRLDPTTWGNTSSRVKIGSGYPAAVFPAMGSVGDVTGDGIADLWARKTDNTMIGWPGKVTDTVFSFGPYFAVDGASGGARIPAGTTLTAGQSYTSRSAKLTMKDDGNLEVTSNAGKPLWSTGTSGNTGAKAVMQSNGNLVVYKADGSTVLWESKTSAADGYALLQDRGNLIVYNAKGQSLWSSGTVTRHDYNADGRSDMGLWYDFSAGSDATYTLLTNSDGSFKDPLKSFTAAIGAWDANSMKFVTGDFNGDGRGDLAALYGYSDTSIKLWTAFGKADGGFNTPFESWSSPPGRMHTSYMTPQAGDFNGDGRDDIAVWYAYPDGTTKLWTFTAAVTGKFNAPFDTWSAPSGTWSRARTKFVTGDFNADGRDDLGVFYGQGDNSVKTYAFRTTPAGGFAAPEVWWESAALDWNRSTPHAGDFNGDGRDDAMIWYDYPDGSDKVSTILSTTVDGKNQFGSAFVTLASAAGNWDIKRSQLVIGDYNGDGRDDIGAMHHLSDGSVKTWTWTARPDALFNGGLAGYTALATQWVYASTRFFKPYN
ncbi:MULTISPECIES: FG-GAP-like repeat-containing protein [unclassified Streptomyces]|uniref:FG-GAP-like repeat-containing protein n=1 Tax=unclassified Streptomyces TaxID=2593676 RepID=UPI002DDAEA60|nr:FG-GAP-like repeat-containing protein [Streptomyces sp. NBC_01750]WSB02766.1 FG-GAP-like repeat-containing protein [Streptomyces sp. NBC_01794]WSD32962.1 FG-GAP-like repeat-containing protein [Streptomyces sp. NBC_01750]